MGMRRFCILQSKRLLPLLLFSVIIALFYLNWIQIRGASFSKLAKHNDHIIKANGVNNNYQKLSSPSGPHPSLSASVISNYYNLSKFYEVEKEMQKRVKRVEIMCQKYHLGTYNWEHNGRNDLNQKEPPTPLYHYWFWNKAQRLGWCPVYKAGSSSWLYNMMLMAGLSERQLNTTKQLSVLAREIYGDAEPDSRTVISSMKLLIVRHPFDRLLSAYRDKLSNASEGPDGHSTTYFYQKYGSKIVLKYRTANSSLTQREPTWEEFIQYILSTDLSKYSDDHWLPVFYSCTPCLVKYDFVAQVETYSRDQEFLIWKLGLTRILKPKWTHSTSTLTNPIIKGYQKNPKSAALAQAYFSKLTKQQIKQLHQKYSLDFILFGYDPQDYLHHGL